MPNIRYTAAVALCTCAIGGAFSLIAHAGQSRSVSSNVYSPDQAARGRLIYQMQCADCHGNAAEGDSGPPLAGNDFLSNWGGRSLAELVDKIQKTMPFGQPASLSRQQSTELTAYILQASKFPPGQGELKEEALTQISFTARPSANGAAPEGNLAELMRAIAFPNANIIFNVQLKDPGIPLKKPLAVSPFDYVEWGTTVYPGWLSVDQAAIALTETAPLFLTPGRRCQNGRPVPIERADWKQYVSDLVDVGKLARRASQARNFAAFVDISEKLDAACANCHKAYRDRGGAEGSGANRCPSSPQDK